MNKHFDKIVIDLEEHIHRFAGIGLIRYIYYPDRLILLIFHNDNKICEYNGNEAQRIYELTQEQDEIRKLSTNNISKSEIKRIAAGVVGVDIKVLNSRKRLMKAVWGRTLCMWYFREYMFYSYADCGAVFNLDHATALFHIRKMNNIYMNGWHEHTKNLFIKRIKSIHDYLNEKNR